MKSITFKKLSLKLALIALMILPELADAQFFNYNSVGDVLAGFRKTGVNAGKYELVVDLGSVTNFLAQPAGTTVTISNFSPAQLTDAFTDTGGFQNLQWSLFSAFYGLSGSWVTPTGVFPKATLWLTVPTTGSSTQSIAPARVSSGESTNVRRQVDGVGVGAITISQFLNITNTDNNSLLVREPIAGNYDNTLSFFIGDFNDNAEGDFGANNNPLPFLIENTTTKPFSAVQRNDFYQFVPAGQLDPGTGQTNGNAYFVGYFLLYPNGSETFTRAAAVTAPIISSVGSTVTNGFAPLTVVFTNSDSGTITNWDWNFGNGVIITNLTGADVTNTYTAGGDYTVTLTVSGPAGSSTNILANYIIASPTPALNNLTLSGNKLIIGGTNGPVGVEYRILESTNLINWIPVLTNTIGSNGSYGYTNSAAQPAAFFQLVSP